MGVSEKACIDCVCMLRRPRIRRKTVLVGRGTGIVRREAVVNEEHAAPRPRICRGVPVMISCRFEHKPAAMKIDKAGQFSLFPFWRDEKGAHGHFSRDCDATHRNASAALFHKGERCARKREDPPPERRRYPGKDPKAPIDRIARPHDLLPRAYMGAASRAALTAAAIADAVSCRCCLV